MKERPFWYILWSVSYRTVRTGLQAHCMLGLQRPGYRVLVSVVSHHILVDTIYFIKSGIESNRIKLLVRFPRRLKKICGKLRLWSGLGNYNENIGRAVFFEKPYHMLPTCRERKQTSNTLLSLLQFSCRALSMKGTTSITFKCNSSNGLKTA